VERLDRRGGLGDQVTDQLDGRPHLADQMHTKPAAQPSNDPNSISGDGTFAVGSQIKPGTYRTVVPNDSLDCYYERLKDASGSFDAIIANNNGSPGSQQIVEIKAADKFFKTEGCGTWTKVG
jgi:hypothetical protein